MTVGAELVILIKLAAVPLRFIGAFEGKRMGGNFI